MASKKKESLDGLSERQRLFVHEYLIDLVGVKAARRAGYKGNSKTLGVQVARNLRHPKIKAEVDRRIAARLHTLELKAEDVVAELASIGFSRITDFIEQDDDGVVTIKRVEDLPESCIAAISEVENAAGKTSIKLHNKMQALERLAKHMGLDAPSKHALTDVEGKDVEQRSMTDIARAIAFALRAGQEGGQ